MPAITAILSALASLLSSSAARFIALRVVLSFLFITVLPIILNNVFYDIMSIFINSLSSHLSSTHPFTVQLTGLAAFLASHLQLVSFVSILMSALALRATFKLFALMKP